MDPSLIYAKTPKGLIEIRTRSGRLSPLMRRVLIMINGRSEFDELAPAVPPGQLAGIIAALEADGLIEVSEVIPTALPEADSDGLDLDLGLPDLGDGAPQRLEPRFNMPPSTLQGRSGPPPTLRLGVPGAPARPAASAPQALSSLPPAQGLDERKTRAVRELFNLLGPYGESAAASIRESTTIGDLLDSLREAGSRISIFRGQAVARDYLRTHGIDVDAMMASRAEAQSRG